MNESEKYLMDLAVENIAKLDMALKFMNADPPGPQESPVIEIMQDRTVTFQDPNTPMKFARLPVQRKDKFEVIGARSGKREQLILECRSRHPVRSKDGRIFTTAEFVHRDFTILQGIEGLADAVKKHLEGEKPGSLEGVERGSSWASW